MPQYDIKYKEILRGLSSFEFRDAFLKGMVANHSKMMCGLVSVALYF